MLPDFLIFQEKQTSGFLYQFTQFLNVGFKKKSVNLMWAKGNPAVNQICPAGHQFFTSCCLMGLWPLLPHSLPLPPLVPYLWKCTFLIFLLEVLSLCCLNHHSILLIALLLCCLVPLLSTRMCNLCLPWGNKFLKSLVIIIISMVEFCVRHCA